MNTIVLAQALCYYSLYYKVVGCDALISGGTPTGYQLVAPAYYDQSGQLVMGNGRGIGPLVRLVSPTPLLMNSPAAQQSMNSNHITCIF
jgi:hypothetical protein